MLSESLHQLLLRLSESGTPAILPGGLAGDHFGPAFDRLLAGRILIEREPITEWDACPGCECEQRARLIHRTNAGPVARCPLDASLDLPLDNADLREFEIDVDVLVTAIATQSGLSKSPEEVATDLWLLGSTHDRALFLALGQSLSQPAATTLLRSVAPGKPIAVICPEPSSALRREFETALVGLASLTDVLREADSFALDLERIGPVRKPRFVVRRSSRTAMVDGAERLIREYPFKVLVLLAERATGRGGFVPSEEIEICLWGNKVHQVTRPIRDVVKDLRRDLRGRQGTPPDHGELVQTRRNGGYRLALAAAEIQIDP